MAIRFELWCEEWMLRGIYLLAIIIFKHIGDTDLGPAGPITVIVNHLILYCSVFM